jgi:protein ImuB
VYGLETFPDHRPERAYRRMLPGHARDGSSALQRPLWLLAQPRRLSAADAPALLDGPERVESGWWDDFDVKRDYFVARDSAGSKLWLYRERAGGQDWFVHGIFA